MLATNLNTRKKSLKRRKGQGMTEYIIIVGLIAILMVAAVLNFKNALNNAFSKGADKIKTSITDKMS